MSKLSVHGMYLCSMGFWVCVCMWARFALLCLSNAHWSKMVECSRRVLHGGAVHSGGLGAGK